jgi:hypothetical protein
MLLCSGKLNAQNILTFFTTLPDSSVLQLSKQDRELIAKVSMDNKTAEDAYADMNNGSVLFALDVVDVKNGYLHLIGAFEGHIQMCYWNMKDGTKLIAVYQEGCGPACYVERFDFYSYDGTRYTALNKASIIPVVFNDFLKIPTAATVADMEQKDVNATLLFDLPRTGKIITAKWGNQGTREVYDAFAKGDRMELTWADGHFEKGRIYWE